MISSGTKYKNLWKSTDITLPFKKKNKIYYFISHQIKPK